MKPVHPVGNGENWERVSDFGKKSRNRRLHLISHIAQTVFHKWPLGFSLPLLCYLGIFPFLHAIATVLSY